METSLFKNLIEIFHRYRGRFIKAIIMVFIANTLLIVNPLLFREAVLIFSKSEQPAEKIFFFPTHSLWAWALLLLTVATISALFKYLMRMEFMTISREIEVEVRGQLFQKMQNQSRTFFDHHGIGELLSRITNDITAYRELLGFGIMYPMFFLTLVVPGFIALFYISTPLALVALIPLGLIPLMNWALRGPIYQSALAVQSALGEMSNLAQEDFAGIRIVKGYAIEDSMLKRFMALCSNFANVSFRLSWLQGLIFPLFILFSKLITLSLVIFAGYIILYQWGQLSGADFLSFMWVQSYIFFPILMLGWVIPIYERGRAAYDRIVEIYNEPIEVQDNYQSKLQVPRHAAITFKDLSFSYPGTEKKVLNQLSLHIEGGSFVGLTGPVAAGKSTLFHLINREYEIPKGHLFVGGHEIHEYSLASLHRAIVTVEQSSFLFSRSLAENVRFGRQEASQAEIETAAQFADLHDTVMGFSEQYETLVGERGVTLSGGQKQRVAMARAFLVDRSILLLDDIFSAVDAATERRIFNSIKRHFIGKTVVLITHRVSILEQMDRILYMSHGEILEDGSPAELLAKKGHYAALAELQFYGKQP